MAFLADMAGHEPNDPLGFRGAKLFAGVDAPFAMAVEPEPSVGIDHHLDDRGIRQRGSDGRSHGGAQHGPLTVEGRGVKAISH